MDFFAGSGTTCHSVLKLNNEDSGNRKFIAVQLPEKIDIKNIAYSDGYKLISEISKERIIKSINDLFVSRNAISTGPC